MPIQYIPGRPGLGQLLGESLIGGLGQGIAGGLSQGIGAGLKSLLTPSEKPQKTNAKALADAFGIPLEQAQQIAQLPPQLQQMILQEQVKAPSRQLYGNILANIVGTPSQEGTAQGTSMQLTPEQIGNNISPLLAAGGLDRQEAFQLAQLAQQQEKIKTQKEQFEKTLSSREKAQIAAAQKQEQKEIRSEVKPYYTEITKSAKAAQKNNMRLARMEELIEKGDLVYSIPANLVGAIPFIGEKTVSAFLNADSAEFEKLSNDFIKEAKDIFGSRLTDADLKAFLKTVPTIYMNDEAKLRVINNLKLLNDASIIQKETMDDIIEEHNGMWPRDLDTLVEKRTKKQLDELSKRFKEGFKPSIKPISSRQQQEAQKELQSKMSPQELSKAIRSLEENQGLVL